MAIFDTRWLRWAKRQASGEPAASSTAESAASPAAPDPLRALLDEGVALRREGRWQAAVDAFDRARQLSPSAPAPLRQLAITHEGLGDLASAAECYQGLLTQDPRSVTVRLALARLQERLGRWAASTLTYLPLLETDSEIDGDGSEAIRAELASFLHRQRTSLIETLRAGPLPGVSPEESAGLHRALADALLAAGLPQPAAVAYRQALDAAPGEVASSLGLGHALIREGRWDEGIAQYRAATRAHPADPQPWLALGLHARSAGDLPESSRVAEHLLHHHPEHRQGQVFRAIVLREQGEHPRAAALLDTCSGAPIAHSHPEDWHHGLRVARLSDATVVPWGPGCSMRRHRAGIQVPSLPAYGYHLRDVEDRGLERCDNPDPPETPTDAAVELPGTHLYAGVALTAFGHFLAECSHRLWAYGAYGSEVDRVLVIPKPAAPGRSSEGLLSFQREALQYAGIPWESVRIVDRPMRAQTLLVPEPGSILGDGTFAPSSAYLGLLAEREADFYAGYQPQQDHYPERLYVGRAHLLHQGGIAGESYLEQRLAAEGFTIFRPEAHSLVEQMNHYRHAREILFTEGSAIHGLELLGPLRRASSVLVLARRPELYARWLPLIGSRTPNLHIFLGTTTLPALDWISHVGRINLNALSLIVALEDLIACIRERTSARLPDFSVDDFHRQEAADVAMHLARTPVHPNARERFLGNFEELRNRVLSVTRNPYLGSGPQVDGNPGTP